VSGVTKDAGPASCAIVASQWAGGAVRENEVLFSVFSIEREQRGGARAGLELESGAVVTLESESPARVPPKL
jgi:hypothetical protein